MVAKGQKFKAYNVLVRLGGSRYNEVRKDGITAPEVMILGSIHGPDSIAETKATGKSLDRSDQAERARLMRVYEGNDGAKRGFVQRVFGPATVPLPRVLEDDYEPPEQVDMQRVSQEMQDQGAEPHAALVG